MPRRKKIVDETSSLLDINAKLRSGGDNRSEGQLLRKFVLMASGNGEELDGDDRIELYRDLGAAFEAGPAKPVLADEDFLGQGFVGGLDFGVVDKKFPRWYAGEADYFSGHAEGFHWGDYTTALSSQFSAKALLAVGFITVDPSTALGITKVAKCLLCPTEHLSEVGPERKGAQVA